MALNLGNLAAATPSQVTTIHTAQVVRADAGGLFVVPLGEDIRNPVGPCRGGWTASGRRVPPGATVMLLETDEGPWVVGVDSAQLATADDLAPFANPSFEEGTLGVVGSGGAATGWSDFWSAAGRHPDPDGPVPAGKYRLSVVDGVAVHGARCVMVETNGDPRASQESSLWRVPAGSTIEVSAYGMGVGPSPLFQLDVWSNTAGEYAGPFGNGAAVQAAVRVNPGAEWARYRGRVTLPPTHTDVHMHFVLGNDPTISTSSTNAVWADNAGAELVVLDLGVAHQDYLRRAALVLAGGGTRTVTAGGNVAWSQPFTIAGAGRQVDEAASGRFEIAQPPNGTVIPVHSSSARVSHTVAGGVIALDPDEALWYDLPLEAAAASQAGRFHILGTTAADNYVVPPNWVLVVRRTAWSSSAHALEYVWGDHVQQDPWRTPTLNAGWIDGTLAPRFTKTAGGLVVMRGRVRNGTGSAFTLPPGYFPTTAHDAIVRDGAGAGALITVTTAGVVTTAGNNADHSIATSFAALGG